MFPMLGIRIFHIGIDDLEGTGERHAQSTGNLRKPRFGLVAVVQIQWGQRGQVIEDGSKFDRLIDMLEFVDALLQSFGDRQIERLDDVAAVRLRGSPAANEEVIDFLVDEVAVALEVLLIDVEQSPSSFEAPVTWVPG